MCHTYVCNQSCSRPAFPVSSPNPGVVQLIEFEDNPGARVGITRNRGDRHASGVAPASLSAQTRRSMRWSPPTSFFGVECARMEVRTTIGEQGEETVNEITTMLPGLGKECVPCGGVQRAGQGGQAQDAAARADDGVLRERAGVRGGDGGVRERAPLGAAAAGVGSRGAADSPAAREGVRKTGWRNKNDYNDARAIAEAVQRPDMRFVGDIFLEDGGAAGCAGAASAARGAGGGAHGAVQSGAWAVVGERDRDGAGVGEAAPAPARGDGGRGERAE